MKQINKNKIALGLTAVMMGFGGTAMAAEQTGTAQVSTNIPSSCTVSFDNAVTSDVTVSYNPLNPHPGKNAEIQVQCTKTTAYEIGLSVGNGGSENSRIMKNGNNSLSYTLDVFGDTWGDIGSANSYKDIGNGMFQFVLFAYKIPANQYVAVGTYTDDLVITFNY